MQKKTEFYTWRRQQKMPQMSNIFFRKLVRNCPSTSSLLSLFIAHKLPKNPPQSEREAFPIIPWVS